MGMDYEQAIEILEKKMKRYSSDDKSAFRMGIKAMKFLLELEPEKERGNTDAVMAMLDEYYDHCEE